MEWHVWGPTDTEPTIYQDAVILQHALSQFTGSDTVLVRTYKRIDMGAQVYNGPGGIPLPSAPTNPPASVSVQITHIRKA